MLKKILVVVLVAVVAFLAFVASRPDSFKVERSTVVAAAPEKVYPLVADLRKMETWSPWEKLDPKMKKDYEGEMGTPGSSYRWAGNDEVGKGKMTLLEASPPSVATYKLEFFEPYQSVATSGFRLAPEGPGTKVVWGMEGKLSFTEKLVGVFMNWEKAIAKDFDEGLAALKAIAEQPDATAAPAPAQGSGG